MISKIISFISGIIFGVGLSVSNMINPEKVLGFLDLFGQWDPSLIFVMIGAIIVSAPVFFLFRKICLLSIIPSREYFCCTRGKDRSKNQVGISKAMGF